MIDNGKILPDAGASFEATLPEITPMSPASGDTFNPIYQQLLNNVVVIKQAVEAVTEAHEQIKQLVQQVETTSAEAGRLAQEKQEKIEQIKTETATAVGNTSIAAETAIRTVAELIAAKKAELEAYTGECTSYLTNLRNTKKQELETSGSAPDQATINKYNTAIGEIYAGHSTLFGARLCFDKYFSPI